jgi:uncharacterized protein YcfL
MRKYTILVLILGMLASCSSPSSVKIEKHTIVGVFKKRPISIHDEISPRYYAVLDNGDTVSVGETTRPYDTITYKYYQYVENR